MRTHMFNFCLVTLLGGVFSLTNASANCLSESQAVAAINAKHNANSWLGAAIGGLQGSAAVGGWHQQYTSQNGSIWISACQNTGAHIVQGYIHDAYNRVGEKNLGFPVSDEFRDANNNPVSNFTNGSIWYQWGNASAFAVQGYIQDKWNFLNTYQGALGYPISDEQPFSDSNIIGRISHFKNGDIVYKNGGSWQTGTFPILKEAYWNNRIRYDVLHHTQTSAVVQVSVSGFKAGSKLDLWVNTWQGNIKIQSKTADSTGSVSFQAQNFDTNDAGYCPYTNCILTLEVNDGQTQFEVVGARM